MSYWCSPDGGVTWSSVETMGEVASVLGGGPLTVRDLRRGSVSPCRSWRWWDMFVRDWRGYHKALCFAYLPSRGGVVWMTFAGGRNASWRGGVLGDLHDDDELPYGHPVRQFARRQGWR